MKDSVIAYGAPPRCGKTWRSKHDKLLSELVVSDITLRDYVGEVDPEMMAQDVINQAIDNVVKALKEIEPNTPNRILRAFVVVFMEIDWDSEEAKLLDKYLWSL